MTTGSPLSTIFMLLFLSIACFYLLRLIHPAIWMAHLDAENEVGHGMMAVGMVFMLAPASWLSLEILRWNSILFALASLWWTVRLFTRKPLLAILLHMPRGSSTMRADAMHVLMHGGMCYLFLLMSSMALSMTRPAIYLICIFVVSFTFLTFFYGREIAKDLHSEKRNWLQLGANVAHVLMNGMMCWMFLQMISMALSMSAP